MHPDFQNLMAEATRLTREGRLAEATATLQRALGAAQPAAAVASPVAAATATVIDAPSRFVDDDPTAPAPAAAPPPAPDVAAPRILRGTFDFTGAGQRAWRLAIPAGSAPVTGRPLLVMLHGCTQDADDFARGTRMDELAGERGWLVLYPEQSPRANPQGCWQWFKTQHQHRERGEAALIASLTRSIAMQHGADLGRIHVAGLSAGGAMAAQLAHLEPQLFSSVAVHSGLPAGCAKDLPSGLQAMQQGLGGPAQPITVPTLIFHGDKDSTVHPSNALALARSATPEGAREGPAVAQRGATRHVTLDAQGQTVVERWMLHGIGHAWAGGAASGSHTAPGCGVDASRLMLDFFEAHPDRGGDARGRD